MKTNSIYYDMIGNELREGDIVAAPLWQDKRMVIGTIVELDYYRSTNREEDVTLHRVIIPQIGDRTNYALWKGPSLVKLPEQDAVMLRLRNLEPFEEDASA